MACTSVTLSGLGVGCKDSMGGIREVYIARSEEVSAVTVTTDTDGYKTISGITMATGTGSATYKFKTFQVRKQTSSMTSTVTTDETVGTFSVQTDLALQFTKMTVTKSGILESLMKDQLAVIVLDQNGKYWYMGLNNPVYCTACTAQTGTAMGDLNGYNITLTDIDNSLPLTVVFSGTFTKDSIIDSDVEVDA